jgi:chitinase
MLAFIQSIEGKCEAGWAGISALSEELKWGKNLTDQLTKNNISYAVSFGGTSGVDLSIACNSVTDLKNIYEQVIATFQPNALDFDIEGVIQTDTIAIDRMMSALKLFQQNHPKVKITLTLPTMPEGLTTLGEDIVKKAINSELIFSVNIMAMDYGTSYDKNMGDYAIQGLKNLSLLYILFLRNINHELKYSKISKTNHEKYAKHNGSVFFGR